MTNVQNIISTERNRTDDKKNKLGKIRVSELQLKMVFLIKGRQQMKYYRKRASDNRGRVARES